MNAQELYIIDKILGSLIPFQSLIFAIILFLLSRDNSKSKRILAYYMFVNSLYYTYLAFFYSGNFVAIVNVYYLIVPIALLVQPFFYFYIRSLTNPDFRCSYRQIIHFIPSAIILIMNISLYSFLTKADQIQLLAFENDSTNKIQEFFFQLHTSGYHIIFGIQALVYLFFVSKTIFLHKKYLPKNFSNYEGVNLNWLITLLTIFIIGSTVQELLGNIDQLAFNVNARIYYNLFILFTIAFIGISAIKQKEIYNYKNKTDSGDIDILEEKYSHSSLNKEVKEELISKLETYLLIEKPFLKNDLRLDDIATDLNTNRQYLSQVINERYQKNFYTLINDLRIKEVKNLFLNQKHKQLSIMGVANTVGFNSKSTFNTLFKKSTGLTPSQFIKENQL